MQPRIRYPPAAFNDRFSSISTLSHLKQLHASILTLGLSHRLALTTKLISLACTLSPSVSYARQLFDAMPLKDSFTWNTLIRGYATTGPCEQVPVLYSRMHRAALSPDHFTFPFVVRSCALLSAIREGKQAHSNIVKHGFGFNVYVQSALVAMYAQNDELADGELVFREMGVRNVVSWTAMIAGYAQSCLFGKAVGVFRSMVSSQVQPNEVTFASILPACNGVGWLHSGKSIHGFAVKSGMDTYSNLLNALIMMYGKCGSIEHSRLLFDGMPYKCLTSWNALIAAYEQNGHGREAIELFDKMQAEKVRCNAVTLVSVASACGSLGNIVTGRWVHGLAKSEGLETDVRLGNALLDMYAKCGSLYSARCTFDNLKLRGVVSWSAMIGAYSAHGHADKAIKLFSEMKAEGVTPNSVTFTSVLTVCSHSGRVEEGLQYFDSIKRDYGIPPTLEHYACIVDLLSRAGRLKEAYEFIKRMQVKPDTGLWGAFLGGCRIHGDLELAEFVMEDLFRSEPHNLTFCMLMSNMYADAGRWEDAARMRKIMKDRELKKIVGHSFLEMEKMPHGQSFIRIKVGSFDFGCRSSGWSETSKIVCH